MKHSCDGGRGGGGGGCEPPWVESGGSVPSDSMRNNEK